MKIDIRTPQTQEEWDRYYEIRYNELRKPWGQPVGSEKDDKEKDAFHYALYVDNKMAGVLRMDLISGSNTSQLRFMAIDKNYQGKSLGNLLMEHANKHAKSLGVTEIILHAREKAVSFYERQGYKIMEKSHLLFDDIQHFKMNKSIL